jgi:hypothetical protein
MRMLLGLKFDNAHDVTDMDTSVVKCGGRVVYGFRS